MSTMSKREQVLEAALRKIMHHCEVAATHAAIYAVAENALKKRKP